MKRLYRDDLTKGEIELSRVILDLGVGIKDTGITSLADMACVSNALVVKYCKKLGFSGYKELKYYVLENSSETTTDGDDYLQFQRIKTANFFHYINNNYDLVSDLVSKINAADYVVFYGFGPSLGVANYFAPKINVLTGKPVIVLTDEQVVDLEIKSAKQNRLFIVLSASLNTPLLIDKIKWMNTTGDNYSVIYENTNMDLKIKNHIKLVEEDISYRYSEIRDRTLFFLYFELVVNELKRS